MRTNDIDAWLLQETWLEDDVVNTTIGGYHIFRHNSLPGTTGRDHLFQGVAIILSPRYYLAWKAAGSPSPTTTDPTGEFAGRFIGLTLKFDCFDSHGKRVRGKSLSIFLSSVYHPCHDILHEQFIETLNSLLHKVPKNSHIIIGADINAKIGRRDNDDLSAALGPHGPRRRNTQGSNLLDLYLSRELRVKNTFFTASTYTTFSNIKDNNCSMIDIFACSEKLHCRVRNCRVVLTELRVITLLSNSIWFSPLSKEQTPMPSPVVQLTGVKLLLILPLNNNIILCFLLPPKMMMKCHILFSTMQLRKLVRRPPPL
jgi:hypothetical protein